MQLLKNEIKLIISEVILELERNDYLKKKYSNIWNKPKIKRNIIFRKMSYDEIKKYIFEPFFIDNNNINFYKTNIITKWFWNFYSLNNDFINSIKVIFIKKFLKKVSFCPYCWKNPLIFFWDLNNDFSNKDDSRRTFQLDHFFPKDKYDNLGFNLYNLIPSCSSCNHLKSNNNPLNINKWEKIFHPYFWWININTKNKYYFIEKDFDSIINFSSSNNQIPNIINEKHFHFFNLNIIYSNSQDTKNDIIFINDKIEKIKTDEITLKSFNNRKITFKELDNMKEYFFKHYYPQKESEILMYPNWKLKKDLINNVNNYL